MQISILKRLPVGGIVLPRPVGIGFVKVPAMVPITHVQ
jgi:hypothetical protein